MKAIISKTLRGIKWTAASSVFRGLTNILVLILLSFYLSPAELGVVSIVTVFFGISETFANFGITQSIIRRENISNSELTSIFWFNLIVGSIIFISFIFFSKTIAHFFETPELEQHLLFLAVVFLFAPLDMINRALLEKSFLFKTTELSLIIRTIVLLTTACVLLYFNFGVTGYVAAIVISRFSSMIFIVIYSKNLLSWSPTLHFNFIEIKNHLEFGTFVSLKNLVSYVGRNFDELIVGKLLGLEILGIYYFAKRITETPRNLLASALGKVIFPLFARVKQDGLDIKDTYLTTNLLFSYTGLALTGFVLLFSNDILILLFDTKWQDAAYPIKLFCLISCVSVVYVDSFMNSILYIYEKHKFLFMVDLILTPIRLILIFIAAQYSLSTVILSFLLVIIVKSYLLQSKVTNVLDLNRYLYFVSKPIQNTVIIIFLFSIFQYKIELTANWISLITQAIIYIFIYIIMILYRDLILIEKIKSSFSSNS